MASWRDDQEVRRVANLTWHGGCWHPMETGVAAYRRELRQAIEAMAAEYARPPADLVDDVFRAVLSLLGDAA